MSVDPILRVVAKLLIPPIFILALYVQFHGDFGPGGGFQAGAIFAMAVILYGLVYGIDTAKNVIPKSVLIGMTSGGLLLFTGVGVVNMLLGGEFLDYNTLPWTQQTAQVVGIITVEFGVGLTVAGVVLLIFFALVDFREQLS
jgi:multicomponent Na+:H+ antiporter subunit B